MGSNQECAGELAYVLLVQSMESKFRLNIMAKYSEQAMARRDILVTSVISISSI